MDRARSWCRWRLVKLSLKAPPIQPITNSPTRLSSSSNPWFLPFALLARPTLFRRNSLSTRPGPTPLDRVIGFGQPKPNFQRFGSLCFFRGIMPAYPEKTPEQTGTHARCVDTLCQRLLSARVISSSTEMDPPSPKGIVSCTAPPTGEAFCVFFMAPRPSRSLPPSRTRRLLVSRDEARTELHRHPSSIPPALHRHLIHRRGELVAANRSSQEM